MTTPRLNSDVYFVPTDDGVCFLTNRGMELFKGASIYAWVERLAPHLDGRRTLAELVTGLADDKRAMVEKLVSALIAKGLAKDVAAERPDTLQPWERQRYGPQIAYLEHFVDSPASAFQRYRDSRFLVVGSGLVFTALVRSVVLSGVRRVAAAVTDEDVTDNARLRDLVEACRDERQTLDLVERHDTVDELARLVSTADVVLHGSDRPVPGRAPRLSEQCAEQGRPLIQATMAGDEAWIGPVCGGAVAWESAWRRLRDHATAAGLMDDSRAASPYLAGPAVALVANQVAVTAFRLVTGAEEEPPVPVMRCLDLPTLRTTTHRCHPHPAALPARPATEADLLARVDELRRGDRIDADTFDQRAATLLDGRLGIFVDVTEKDLAQVPLNVATVTVTGPPSPTTVAGAGLDFRTARWRAAMRAIAHYAHARLDPRRTVPGRHGPDVWGHDLAADTPRRVRAALAFAPGDPRGVAARYDWDGAVTAGLLAHVQALTVAEAVADGRPFREVDLDALDLDEDATTCRSLLDIAGVPVAVHDVTGSLGVPTFAFSAGPRTVTYACDLRRADAVRAGLEQTLLDYQARANGQPEYSPPEVPDLPPDRRDAPAPGDDRAGPADRDAVVSALARAGHIPVVVPLDHDPALLSVNPYVVSVVLADD